MVAVNVEADLEQTLIDFRRTLHSYPELSLHEYETTERIAEALDEYGIERLPYTLETGVIAIVRGTRPGPTIAIRADIDALPIHEQTGLAFASTVAGKMHACGHDFHTAAVLGSAVLIKRLAEGPTGLAGNVLFVFQPAEEVGNGASAILKTGVFEDYEVRCILGEHNNPLQPTGTFGFAAGPLMASVDEFSIEVEGVGGHAAIPELTVDPVLVGAHLVAGLQHLVSRNARPLDAVVVTVGEFHAGTARNIIPTSAVLEGTVRCLQPQARALMETRLRTFVEQTALAFGATATLTYENVLPGVVNDEEITAQVRMTATRVLGDAVVVDAVPSLGGEDFALYQQHLPGCFFWAGTGKPDGTSKGWHHPGFDVDESMLAQTSELFTEAALDLLAYFANAAE